MTPVEWPIAAPSPDGGPDLARVAGSSRLAVARADFFLDPRARLTEQERSLMTAMLTDLVEGISDEFSSGLSGAANDAANDWDQQVFETLWSSGLLDIPDLIALLLRRAQEERIAAAIRSGRNPLRFLQSLVSDENSAVSGAAMALVLAKGRRKDRFGGPRILFDDLSAEAAVALVNAVAAAMRSDHAKRDGAGADERLSAAANALIGRHDEGGRLEARAFELVHALDRAGRLDDTLLRSALTQGEVGLLFEALARRGGISGDCAWEQFTGGSGRLAMLLRICSVPRELAGEVVALVADLSGSDPETEISIFDSLSDEEVEASRKWLRLSAGYRSAIERLDRDHGQRSL
jgi:hypothetical protein